MLWFTLCVELPTIEHGPVSLLLQICDRCQYLSTEDVDALSSVIVAPKVLPGIWYIYMRMSDVAKMLHKSVWTVMYTR